MRRPTKSKPKESCDYSIFNIHFENHSVDDAFALQVG